MAAILQVIVEKFIKYIPEAALNTVATDFKDMFGESVRFRQYKRNDLLMSGYQQFKKAGWSNWTFGQKLTHIRDYMNSLGNYKCIVIVNKYSLSSATSHINKYGDAVMLVAIYLGKEFDWEAEEFNYNFKYFLDMKEFESYVKELKENDEFDRLEVGKPSEDEFEDMLTYKVTIHKNGKFLNDYTRIKKVPYAWYLELSEKYELPDLSSLFPHREPGTEAEKFLADYDLTTYAAEADFFNPKFFHADDYRKSGSTIEGCGLIQGNKARRSRTRYTDITDEDICKAVNLAKYLEQAPEEVQNLFRKPDVYSCIYCHTEQHIDPFGSFYHTCGVCNAQLLPMSVAQQRTWKEFGDFLTKNRLAVDDKFINNTYAKLKTMFEDDPCFRARLKFIFR